MPGDQGPLFYADGFLIKPVLIDITTKPSAGDMGPAPSRRMERAALTDAASAGDEMLGKIGPCVGVYDPEGASRMTGEWE